MRSIRKGLSKVGDESLDVLIFRGPDINNFLHRFLNGGLLCLEDVVCYHHRSPYSLDTMSAWVARIVPERPPRMICVGSSAAVSNVLHWTPYS